MQSNDMQAANTLDNGKSNGATRRGRLLIGGLSIALLAGAAMALGNSRTEPAPNNIAVSSIDGDIIVAFDTSRSSGNNNLYRVDCNAAVGGGQAHGEANKSPVVVRGLMPGSDYDCRASMAANARVSKPFNVHVMGAD